ncbi:MAG: YbaN family protein [Thermoanaerobaculales bacterium]|jgi:hypothetical protein|nr:YbaN family protein [Thermoanaerobaculales bacterium]
MSHAPPPAQISRSRARRWLLAALGVGCVGCGAVGVVVPGLPTTIFLIAGSWCFARSCPWLEERLIRVPLFRPFLGYLEPGAGMPRRAVVLTLVVMWLAIAASSAVVGLGEPPRPLLAGLIVALGLVGSVFVLRLRKRGAPGSRA